MTAQYFTVLTDYGIQVFAKAIATNQPIQFSSFAVGDGNGQAVTPTADRTALVKETHRANVSAVSLDPRNNKQIIIELTIPEDVGGFYIREMGVFDSANKLVAYANAPESFKPTLESGSGKVQVLRMILKVSNSQAVTLSIDNSVIFVTRQQLTPQTITSSTTNGFDESGHTHEIEKGDTTKAGIVQLTDDTGLDSDKLGLSARAGKKLAQLISTVQLALGNYIQNNKKSNSVTSNSTDDVATSSAVKTAYDKAIEANNNANNRVSKAGDEMSGSLRASGFSAKENYGAFEIFNSNETLRIEKEAQNFKFWRRMPGKSDVANYMPLTSGRLALEDDVNRKVSKSGDDIQWLNVKRGHAWLNVTSTAHGSSAVNFTNSNGRHAQVSIEAVDIGGWADELRLHATPPGENYDTDRRQHIATFSPIGDVWTKTYGWLHEFYAKQSDNNNIWNELNNTYRKSRFGYRWYPNHYEGAQVIDIPTSDNSVIRITTMGVTIEGTQTINLPELYNGFTKVVATDVGVGRRAVGIRVEGNNKLVIDNGYQTGLNIIVIGHFGW